MADPSYLRKTQYRDDSKLAARIALHARFSVNAQGWHRWLFQQCGVLSGERVLDIGCGPGTLWVENHSSLPDRLHLVLADFSGGMLRAARRELRGKSFVVADARRLPFADASVDVVVCAHMLYHVPERTTAIAEIARVLKPAGRAIVTTNGAGHLREVEELIQRAAPRYVHDDGLMDFGLENAAESLAASFPSVRRVDFDDRLEVTDPDALLAYILSMPVAERLEPAQVQELKEIVQATIDREGCFRVKKSTGALLCRLRSTSG